MSKTEKLLTVIGVMSVVVIIGGAATVFLDTVTFRSDLWAVISPRLQLMLVMAIVIERAVEVYLYASDQNGPDRFLAIQSSGSDRQPATRTAILCALFLGVLIAAVGVRILDAAIEGSLSDIHDLHAFILGGIDTLVSAGLMAGGSALVHEVTELLRGGLNIGSRALSKDKEKRSSNNQELAVTSKALELAEYQVTITRTGNDTGTLTFNEKGVPVNTTCWWDPAVKIAAGTYQNCSATRMATKTDSVTGQRRPGIWLPTAIAPDTGANTIFIHEGKDPSWSDGCIVIERNEMMRIWNVIEKDAENVTVRVS